MGFTSAFLAGTALSVISGLHSKNKMEKSQRSAEIAAREAAKRNVTVQSSGAESTRAESENESASYVAQQNAKKRRQGMRIVMHSTASILHPQVRKSSQTNG